MSDPDVDTRAQKLSAVPPAPKVEYFPPARPERVFAPQVPDHELLRRIGGGSYGQVWLARNVMGTYRAVKVVYRRSFEHDRPYEREFEGILKFEPVSRSHPGLMDILQVGRNDEAGYFYYVMELADDEATGSALEAALVTGVRSGPADGMQPGADVGKSSSYVGPETYSPKTLRSGLRNRGRLSSSESVRVGLSLTEALDHLHEQGLVHRDIKPSNIIFVGGLLKLADIGLVAEAGHTLSCVGTEGFMPPEGPGSAQADLYSLGKVLYEMSTGKDRQDYPDPPTDLALLPDQQSLLELNEVIFKACALDIRQRYASAQAMQRDLLLVQSGQSVKRLHLLEAALSSRYQDELWHCAADVSNRRRIFTNQPSP